MSFSRNFKAFLRSLPLYQMSGQQKFLAISARLVKGRVGKEISVREVKRNWSKSLLRVKYSPSFYSRAQEEEWVDPIETKKGLFVVTRKGIAHLEDLASPATLMTQDREGQLTLMVFKPRSTHSFDKYLRGLLATAKKEVSIVDPRVDDTIFDNVLDAVPSTTKIRFIYTSKRGAFDSRLNRFSVQYNIALKRKKNLHDRFIIIDGNGYVLGPSIKDAATRTYALLVTLTKKDSKLLQELFSELWK